MNVEQTQIPDDRPFNNSRIISILSFLLVMAITAYGVYTYYLKEVIIESRHRYFQFTTPGKFKFTENDLASSDYEMAVYDANIGLYIFGDMYTLDEEKTFKEYVESDRDSFLGDEATSNLVNDIEELKINDGFDAMTYSLSYEDDDTTYYSQVFWIKTEEFYYLFDVECLLADKSKYEDQLKDIVLTFKELD